MLPDWIPTSRADCKIMMHVKTANGQRQEQQEEAKTQFYTILKAHFASNAHARLCYDVCPFLSRSLHLVANLYSLTGVNLHAYWEGGC